MSDRPDGHATLLTALEEHLVPTRTVILRGPESELPRWRTGSRNAIFRIRR